MERSGLAQQSAGQSRLANNVQRGVNGTDRYPSRNGQASASSPRQVPVVYASDRGKSPLGDELTRQYEKDGFLVLEGVFSPEEVAAYSQELQRLAANEDDTIKSLSIKEAGSGALRSVFGVHEVSRVFETLAGDKRLADIAQYLLADDVYIHQSRINYKPGFRGREFYWHSDFETWHVEDGMPDMRALSISVSLTDNYQHNGSLMVIPGSHKRFVACEGETPESHYKSSLQRQELGTPPDSVLQELVGENGVVTITGKPGSIVIFDCNLMHGSNGNITPYPRSNVFYVYNALSNRPGAPYCGQQARPEHVCARRVIRPIPSHVG